MDKIFEKEKKVLLDKLGQKILRIEHVGSTAIPDILAKPIIDINLGISDIDDDSVNEIIKPLKRYRIFIHAQIR